MRLSRVLASGLALFLGTMVLGHQVLLWNMGSMSQTGQGVSPPPPDYNVSVSPASLTIGPGFSATTTVTVTSLNGFAATTACTSWWGNLDIQANSPNSLAASASPACINLKSNQTSSTTLTVTASPQTTPGNYRVTVSASFQVSPSGWTTWRSTNVLITVTAALTVIGIIGIATGVLASAVALYRWLKGSGLGRLGVLSPL